MCIWANTIPPLLPSMYITADTDDVFERSPHYALVGTYFLHLCLHWWFYEFVWWGVPLDRFEKPQRGLMKGLPAGALGHATQWWNSRWPKQLKSSARRAVGEGQRVGAGWWWGGQVLEPAVCGHGFSMVANKADLFIAIQRCKLLFIKVSHSASSEQNGNGWLLGENCH